jgi:hypothetical protein
MVFGIVLAVVVAAVVVALLGWIHWRRRRTWVSTEAEEDYNITDLRAMVRARVGEYRDDVDDEISYHSNSRVRARVGEYRDNVDDDDVDDDYGTKIPTIT